MNWNLCLVISTNWRENLSVYRGRKNGSFAVSIPAGSRAGAGQEGYCDGCGKDSRGTEGGAGTSRTGDYQSGASGARTRAWPGPAAKLDVRHHAEAARQAAREQEQGGGSGEKFRGGGWAVAMKPGTDGAASEFPEKAPEIHGSLVSPRSVR